ncbi:MAG: hypothetical protein ACRDAM_09440, partial [Casimicrobium sp.]
IEERLCAIEKILGIDDSNDRHARVKLEWSKVKDAGTHELWRAPSGTASFHKCADTPVLWCYGSDYEIRPIKKPKKKLIDKSKLPIFCETNFGILLEHIVGAAICYHPSRQLMTVFYDDLRLSAMEAWICSLPPFGLIGVVTQTLSDNPSAWHIKGIADGYTDDPSEAV